jgi:hypothetical protein
MRFIGRLMRGECMLRLNFRFYREDAKLVASAIYRPGEELVVLTAKDPLQKTDSTL